MRSSALLAAVRWGEPVCEQVWDAGVALCEYLTQRPELVRGKVCIELGSGTGLGAIVAAQLGEHTDASTAR